MYDSILDLAAGRTSQTAGEIVPALELQNGKDKMKSLKEDEGKYRFI
jgi:hypothetical protein